MISENTHTFDTLLLLYRQLLTDKEHINYKINFLSKIKYIAVDEIQDLDEIQLEVVNLIAKYVGACIYCGDAAQSIYADFDILKNKDVMKFKKYYLNQSYRMNLTTTNFTNILRREIYTVTDETVDMIPIKETGQLAKITYHTGDFKSLNRIEKFSLFCLLKLENKILASEFLKVKTPVDFLVRVLDFGYFTAIKSLPALSLQLNHLLIQFRRIIEVICHLPLICPIFLLVLRHVFELWGM